MDPSPLSTQEKMVQLESLFHEMGQSDFKWIDPKDILVRQWVRMKCTYGCPAYGRKTTCPPNTPSVDDCRQFFREYSLAVVFHLTGKISSTDKPAQDSNKRNKAMVGLERRVFLAGYHRALVLTTDTCYYCKECGASRENCAFPQLTRPTPEAMAIDVYATVRSLGFHVEVLTDKGQEMDRYGFLMID